jgi:hypothetical protein
LYECLKITVKVGDFNTIVSVENTPPELKRVTKSHSPGRLFHIGGYRLHFLGPALPENSGLPRARKESIKILEAGNARREYRL